MSTNFQRVKLLLVYRILLEETDEEHPLTAEDLTQRLALRGISCDRRTLSRDMKILNNNDFEIMSRRVGHRLGYYIAERDFDISELTVLADAVRGAEFIPVGKTEKLLQKIAHLGGKQWEEQILSNGVSFSVHKHSNETIFITVSQLSHAIARERRCRIKAFHLNAQGQRVYRHEGEFFTVEPLALMFRDDRYYVLCYDRKLGVIPRRVDRIDRVEIIKGSKLTPSARHSKAEIARYENQITAMYGGTCDTVTLEFCESLCEQIFDRFGEKSTIEKTEAEGICRFTAPMEISPTLWAWLFTYAGKMRITAPLWAVEEYEARLRSANTIRE